VHPPALGADALDDGRLDGLVDVLARGQGAVARRFDVLECGEDGARVLLGDDVLLCEHHDVCAVDGEVGREDALVVGKRGEKVPCGATGEPLAADDGLVGGRAVAGGGAIGVARVTGPVGSVLACHGQSSVFVPDCRVPSMALLASRDWKPWYFATPVASSCVMAPVTSSSSKEAADSL